jgi:DNA-directed RNA polymerase subunit H (RpoH/RPB5)
MDNPSHRVYKNLRRFFESRGLEPVAAEKQADAGRSAGLDADRGAFLQALDHFGFFRTEALAADGQKVVVLLLAARGKQVESGPMLRELLSRVRGEEAAQKGRIAEVLVIVPEEVLAKKNLTDALAPLRETDGRGPAFTLVPYHVFVIDIPRAACVPRYELVPAKEEAALLEQDRLQGKDALGRVAALDPPVVWIGGKPGQLVRIRAPSETAGEAVSYRRVE